jgi:hypothetical protein
MATQKRVIGFSIYQHETPSSMSDNVYQHLTIEMRQYQLRDVTKTLAEYIGTSDEAILLKELRLVKETTGGTVVLESNFSSESIKFEWQSDDKNVGKWYAGSIAMSRIDDEVFKLFARIRKAIGPQSGWSSISPRDFISALSDKLKAVHVRYVSCDGTSISVADNDFDLDAKIPAPPEPETVEV